MEAESLFHYKDILLILGAAGIAIPVLLRLGINSILGFLIVGLFLGPHMLGQVAEFVPALKIFTLSNTKGISEFAELGIVFLLFLIGLELSPERLMTMRRLIFGLGGLQVTVSTVVLTFILKLLGFTTAEAWTAGAALALSSTAIIIQLFSDERRLGSQAGRISFAILLMQDLAVIPILLLIGALSTSSEQGLISGVSWAMLQAAAAAVLIVLIGRYALRPLLRFVAAAQSPDLFMAVVFFIALGTGSIAVAAGLSMSLGAFIAGLTLAETEYRRTVEVTIEPFKGLLLGMFFLMVGLSLDLSLLASMPLQIIATAVGLIAAKAAIIFGFARLFKLPRHSSLEAALLLGPGGEFAFVILASAKSLGVFQAGHHDQILLLVTLTMIAIPFISRFAKLLRKTVPPAQTRVVELPPDNFKSDVIIAGFGRVGSLIGAMLDEQKISYVAIDQSTENIETARKSGAQVYFGDATNQRFLHLCGLMQAKTLAITMDNPKLVDEILKVVRAERPDIKIIARARDERHAIKLYEAGVTEAVPETIEASLQLAEAVLVETGTPMGLAIAAVHGKRDDYRKLLGRPNRKAELAATRSRLRQHLPGQK